MPKLDTHPISVRVSAETRERLEALAKATERSRSWHVEKALAEYLDIQSWQVAHIEAGIAALDKGRTVAHEAVRNWLTTWGGEDERDPPA